MTVRCLLFCSLALYVGEMRSSTCPLSQAGAAAVLATKQAYSPLLARCMGYMALPVSELPLLFSSALFSHTLCKVDGMPKPPCNRLFAGTVRFALTTGDGGAMGDVSAHDLPLPAHLLQVAHDAWLCLADGFGPWRGKTALTELGLRSVGRSFTVSSKKGKCAAAPEAR